MNNSETRRKRIKAFISQDKSKQCLDSHSKMIKKLSKFKEATN